MLVGERKREDVVEGGEVEGGGVFGVGFWLPLCELGYRR